MEQTILELAEREDAWREFLEYKLEKQHLNHREETAIRQFIEEKAFVPLCEACRQKSFPSQYPKRSIVNKEGTQKKRIVYSFEGEEGIFLKFIAFQLSRYDSIFENNCYAFRRDFGVREAMRRIRDNRSINNNRCLKIDISNYFNSINVSALLAKLTFLKKDDPEIYDVFERILSNTIVLYNGCLTKDEHGAMAGIPIAPFFANVYLAEMDAFFAKEKVLYFRYSDDILIFTETEEELNKRQEQLLAYLKKLQLSVNPDKVRISAPGEYWEFLGFGCRNGVIDLSDNTIRKTKAKIKRKAEALRRWQRKKGLSPDKAAIGLIHTMNRKFFGYSSPDDEAEEGLDEFTWSRWFFPNLTTDRGLKEIDSYLQNYIRYAITGRHYKGNYRITYEQLKRWGYVSLTHEFWKKK